MAFAIPVVKHNYALYGNGSSGSSGFNSVSSSPVGSPPKIVVHAAPEKRPPLARSASAKAASYIEAKSFSQQPKKGLPHNSNSFTSFHEALVVKLTKAVRKISR